MSQDKTVICVCCIFRKALSRLIYMRLHVNIKSEIMRHSINIMAQPTLKIIMTENKNMCDVYGSQQTRIREADQIAPLCLSDIMKVQHKKVITQSCGVATFNKRQNSNNPATAIYWAPSPPPPTLMSQHKYPRLKML